MGAYRFLIILIVAVMADLLLGIAAAATAQQERLHTE